MLVMLPHEDSARAPVPPLGPSALTLYVGARVSYIGFSACFQLGLDLCVRNQVWNLRRRGRGIQSRSQTPRREVRLSTLLCPVWHTGWEGAEALSSACMVHSTQT